VCFLPSSWTLCKKSDVKVQICRIGKTPVGKRIFLLANFFDSSGTGIPLFYMCIYFLISCFWFDLHFQLCIRASANLSFHAFFEIFSFCIFVKLVNNHRYHENNFIAIRASHKLTKLRPKNVNR